LAEIEELKKSDRFSASEISMGDSEGLAGKDKNGSMGKEEAEKADEDDKDEDDEDEDKKNKKDKKEDDMDKGEGKNCDTDPDAKSHKVEKEETGMPEGTAAKGEDCDDMDKGEEYFKKSREESETLMKSYIDEKVGGLERKLDAIATAVQDLANSPVPSKGSTYRNVQPLVKSEPETEYLSKSQIVDKLFDLKKSGENVETTDIASAELGHPGELAKIVKKYNIK
jgi:hypothetical protein